MIRKTITYALLTAFTLLLAVQASVSQESLSAKVGIKIKTIYIDPWYGGEEKGPLLAQKQYGKDITLKISQQLEELLKADGFTVYLSRASDQFIPPEQRTFQSRTRGADLYLSIKVSRKKENCIRILLSPLEKKKSQPKSNDLKPDELGAQLNEILKALEANSRHEESLAFAAIISIEMRNERSSDCVRVAREFNYILTNTEMPAVVVDLGVSSKSAEPYILDTIFQDEIVRSLAESIKKYAKEREPQSPKQ